MNKKAMNSIETFMAFVLVLLLVVGLIIAYNRVQNGSFRVVQCTANGGECRTKTCDWGTQIPVLSDKAAGCNKGELCCINITQSGTVVDPKCENETTGFPCGDLKYCTEAKTCVTKCEFCQSFGPPKTAHEDICGEVNVYTQKGTYSCRCSGNQCEGKADGVCITNYCPGDEYSASNYRCCNI